MSLILDALRRAEAERRRGEPPPLGAAVAGTLPDAPPLRPPGEPAPGRRALVLAAAIALVLGAAGLAWWGLRGGSPSPAPASGGALPPVPAQPVAAVPALPATGAVQAAAPPAAVPAGLPRPLPQVVSADPPVPAPAAAASRPPPAPATEAPPLRLADLPAAQRAELPPLRLGGWVHSEQAAQRFVVIDGQVLREGDALAPELRVERIGARVLWLRWRGRRLELPLG